MMKCPIALTAVISGVLSLSLNAEIISQFDFNDPAGTAIGFAVDSAGSIIETTETGPGFGNYVTDGSAAVYGGGQIEPVGNNADGSMFKIRSFDTPLTAANWKSVTLKMVVDFTFVEAFDNSEKGNKVGFALTELVGEAHEKVAEAGIQHITLTQVRPYYIANNEGSGKAVATDPVWGLEQTGITVQCTVDFENGMVVFAYDAGAGLLEYYSEATSVTELAAMRIVGSKGAFMLADPLEVVKVQQVEITGVPVENGGGDDWNGYPVLESGWVDTEGWIGWVYVTDDPWLLSSTFESWIYMAPGQPTDGGAWFYITK